MKLIIGVLDVPHLDDRITTGDLAEILEERYGLFSFFVDDEIEPIADALTSSLENSLDNILAAGGVAENPYSEGLSKIPELFKRYLDTGEIEKDGIDGVPTQAAIDGVTRRRKGKKGARRPSFIDTGLLRTSVVAEMEVDGIDYQMGSTSISKQEKSMKSIKKSFK